MPNSKAIAQKLTSLERFKFIHKTGNRKILARWISPKIGRYVYGPRSVVLAKLRKNRIWKLRLIAILREASQNSKIHLAPSSEKIYQYFSKLSKASRDLLGPHLLAKFRADRSTTVGAGGRQNFS